MARPTYEPTPTDRETVRALSAAGVPQERIAKCLGTYGIDAKSLRKHFRRELDITRDQFTAHVMGKFKQACDRGESWAILSWLKCQAGWIEASKLVHTGADGGAIDISVSSPGELIESRMLQLVERRRAVVDITPVDPRRSNGSAA